MGRSWISAFTLAVSLLASFQAKAADLNIIVDRQAGSVELFVATAAPNFMTYFGLSPMHLTNNEGLVEIDPLRSGTWDIGDALFERTRAVIGGEDATFEAMSLMVHPIKDKLPMTTPFEAMVAVSVCTVDLPGQAFNIADLHGYAGFIAYTDQEGAEATLEMPKTGRTDITVSLRVFEDGVEVQHVESTVPDGGTIVVPERPRKPALVWAAVLGLCGIGAGAGTLALRRRYRR